MMDKNQEGQSQKDIPIGEIQGNDTHGLRNKSSGDFDDSEESTQETLHSLHNNAESVLGPNLQQQVKKRKKNKKNKKKDKNTSTTENDVLESAKVLDPPKQAPKATRRQVFSVERNLILNPSTDAQRVAMHKRTKRIDQAEAILNNGNLNQKGVNAIGNIFGQFFKLQNLKNFQKKSVNTQVIHHCIAQIKAESVNKTVKQQITNQNQSFTTRKTLNKDNLNQQVCLISPQKTRFDSFFDKFIDQIPVIPSILQKYQAFDTLTLQTQYLQPEFALMQPEKERVIHPNKQLTKINLVQSEDEFVTFGQLNREQSIEQNQKHQPKTVFQLEQGQQNIITRDSLPIESQRPSQNLHQNIHQKRTNQVNQQMTQCNNNMNKNPTLPKYGQLDYNQTSLPVGYIGQDDNHQNPTIRQQQGPCFKWNKGQCYQQHHSNNPEFQFDPVQKKVAVTLPYPKRPNAFIPIQEQLSNINYIFKQFDAKNTIKVDSFLSYGVDYEEFQLLKDNLVSEMEKEEENRFVQELQIKQQEWRQIMFKGSRNKGQTQNNNGSKQAYPFQISQQTKFNIKQPKPTQSSSPTKTSFGMIGSNKHSQQPYHDYSLHLHIKQVQIDNNKPLSFATFSAGKMSSKSLRSQSQSQDSVINNNTHNQQYNELSFPSSSTIINNLRQNHFILSKERLGTTRNNMEILEEYQVKSKQIQVIRQFYKDLKQRESNYNTPFHREISPLVSLQSSHCRDAEQGSDVKHQSQNGNQLKEAKGLQNVHGIKGKAKPIILNCKKTSVTHNFAQSDQNQDSLSKNDKHLISGEVTKTIRVQYPTGTNQATKGLNSLMMNMKKNNHSKDQENPTGRQDNQLFFDEYLAQSQEGSTSSKDLGVIKQGVTPRFIFNLTNLEKEQQKAVNTQPKTQRKPQFLQNCSIALLQIQPIKMTQKPTHKQPTPPNKLKLTIIKDQQMIQKALPLKNIIKAPQMSSFLLNSSHIGSLMLNNVIQNFAFNHPLKKEEQLDGGKRQIQTVQLVAKNQAEESSFCLNRKRVTLKKKQQSSTKKLSINQKNLFSNKKQGQDQKGIQQVRCRIPEIQTLNKTQQLKQTISRINRKSQAQILNIVRSRITQRSNSKNSSLYQTPNHKNFKGDSRMLQNSSTLSLYQLNSCQIYPMLSQTTRQNRRNRSNQKSVGKSRNSSKYKRKLGVELWNEGLSELKILRKQNGSPSPKIFHQKSTKQNKKINGITRWNENIAMFKESRSKSYQSRKSYSKENPNKQIVTDNVKNPRNINIQIKKHKYQVSNVQKRYL